MKADIKTIHTEYTIENIMSVNYINGSMVLVYKDNDGTIGTVTFTLESLEMVWFLFTKERR